MKRGSPIRAFLAALLLLCAACVAVKPAQQPDDDFYRSSAQRLGVPFDGTESRALIQASTGWLGVPYRYGGVAKRGVDCSGFVLNVYKEAYGLTLPRTTAAMAKQVRRIRRGDLRCGDLVFFSIKEKRTSHVGIYLGDDKFVHASSSRGVTVADLGDAYWQRYYSGAGRVPNLPSEKVVGAAAQATPALAAAAKSSSPPKPRRAHGKTHAQPNAKAAHSAPAEAESTAAAKVESRPTTQDTLRAAAPPAADSRPAAAQEGATDALIMVFDEEF